jgi:hypothetical protein
MMKKTGIDPVGLSLFLFVKGKSLRYSCRLCRQPIIFQE